MAFKPIVPGTDPLASDVDQFRRVFSGKADIGTITLAGKTSAPSAPTVVASGDAGPLNGTYRYQLVWVTGIKEDNNDLYVSGFAPGAEKVVTISGGKQALITIPSFPEPVIAALLYRTAVNSPPGTALFLKAFVQGWGTWTDAVLDSALGTGMPGATSSPAWRGVAVPAGVPVINSTGTQFVGFEDRFLPIEKELANLEAFAAIDNRALPNSGKFYDLLDMSDSAYSCGMVDKTQTYTRQAVLTVGVQSLPVYSVAGFAVGQEVLIFDDAGSERAKVASISGYSLGLASPLTRTYKKRAVVCRSNVRVDKVARKMRFYGYGAESAKTVTTPQALDPLGYSGDNIRRLLVLENGWFIRLAFHSDEKTYHIYVSKDGGGSWQLLLLASNNLDKYHARNGASICAVGTRVTLIIPFYTGIFTSDIKLYSYTLDVAEITTTIHDIGMMSQYRRYVATVPYSSYFGFNATAVCADSKGVLWTAWAEGKYLYLSQSRDGGSAWSTPVAEASVSPVLTREYPYIMALADGSILAFTSVSVEVPDNPEAIYYAVSVRRFTSTGALEHVTSLDGESVYYRGMASACVDKTGTVWAAFDRLNAVTDRYEIACVYSTNGGKNWSSPVTVSGSQAVCGEASVTCDWLGNVHVYWRSQNPQTYVLELNRAVYDGAVWGSPIALGNGFQPSVVFDQSLLLEFTVPPVLYVSGLYEQFLGTYTAISEGAPTVGEIRINVVPPKGATDEVVTWVERSDESGFGLMGHVSMGASYASESYVAMSKTTSTLSGGTAEDQFMGSASVPQSRVAIRLAATLPGTGAAGVAVRKVLGAVG